MHVRSLYASLTCDASKLLRCAITPETQDSNAQQVMVLASSGQLLRTEHLPCPAVALCFSVDGGLYVGSGLDFFAKLDQSLHQLWKVSE